MMYKALNSLPKRQWATIEHLRVPDDVRTYLMRMGVIEGLQVRILHTGLIKKDPLVLEIGGHSISIRQKDAAHIMVSIAS